MPLPPHYSFFRISLIGKKSVWSLYNSKKVECVRVHSNVIETIYQFRKVFCQFGAVGMMQCRFFRLIENVISSVYAIVASLLVGVNESILSTAQMCADSCWLTRASRSPLVHADGRPQLRNVEDSFKYTWHLVIYIIIFVKVGKRGGRCQWEILHSWEKKCALLKLFSISSYFSKIQSFEAIKVCVGLLRT